MNNLDIFDYNVLKELKSNAKISQRMLANKLNLSLGKINKSIKSLNEHDYINKDMSLTEKCRSFIKMESPNKAVILAAGIGLRMIPINQDRPKALLKVKKEILIERIVKQLHQVGINDISIVVGYKKEEFEYLIDDYDIKLVVSHDYETKNNLNSLSLISNLNNTYVIPCDLYFEENPFSSIELYPWYMVSDEITNKSRIKINRKSELVRLNEDQEGNQMVGLAYFTKQVGGIMKERLTSASLKTLYDHSFWEDIAFKNNKMILFANIIKSNKYYEINTYEQLRDADGFSQNLNSDIIQLLCKTFEVEIDEIKNITAIKKGMTNRSFKFQCKDNCYVVRIPGEGTGELINREEEFEVYEKINDLKLCDEVIYFDPKTGIKITKFIQNARNCNPEDDHEVRLCMMKLKEFHEQKLVVAHTFDLYGKISFYEELWGTQTSVYRDYAKTKENILKLKEVIQRLPEKWTLCHIDSVPDNFIFHGDHDDIVLIDWEYAGMQDAYVDIAMFAIYSLYNKEQVDKLIDSYFDQNCSKNIRIKIYAYIAICGLLWSNWCEYKRILGVDFGEYALRQYRYAKDYYKIVEKEMEINKNELYC